MNHTNSYIIDRIDDLAYNLTEDGKCTPAEFIEALEEYLDLYCYLTNAADF